ncbi:hypothetical protein FA95DRAFT_1561077 [Auriscalpium vulgare]|uniref:Uncharacterized protein n=1 Tax=Auriscalpium vulgare TaxID=40419 RepID=A0ACB8RMU0_9AGAM|nr:hypothetical protein FA95DRAFT_1561077 [Auriscalpium vulgare]
MTPITPFLPLDVQRLYFLFVAVRGPTLVFFLVACAAYRLTRRGLRLTVPLLGPSRSLARMCFSVGLTPAVIAVNRWTSKDGRAGGLDAQSALLVLIALGSMHFAGVVDGVLDSLRALMAENQRAAASRRLAADYQDLVLECTLVLAYLELLPPGYRVPGVQRSSKTEARAVPNPQPPTLHRGPRTHLAFVYGAPVVLWALAWHQRSAFTLGLCASYLFTMLALLPCVRHGDVVPTSRTWTPSTVWATGVCTASALVWADAMLNAPDSLPGLAVAIKACEVVGAMVVGGVVSQVAELGGPCDACASEAAQRRVVPPSAPISP